MGTIKDCNEGTIQEKFTKMIHLYYRNTFTIFKESELHPKQVPLLCILDEDEGMSQKEISQKLNISPPTVAVSIKRLERAGFLERKTDEKDQRKSRIYLTEEGRDMIRKSKAYIEENEKVLFKGFSESELCLLRRFFDQMIFNLEQANRI